MKRVLARLAVNRVAAPGLLVKHLIHFGFTKSSTKEGLSE